MRAQLCLTDHIHSQYAKGQCQEPLLKSSFCRMIIVIAVGLGWFTSKKVAMVLLISSAGSVLFRPKNYSGVGHDDVIKWIYFPRYWPFARGIHRWIPRTKASHVALWCFLWSAPEQTVEQTIETPLLWDVIALWVVGCWCWWCAGAHFSNMDIASNDGYLRAHIVMQLPPGVTFSNMV